MDRLARNAMLARQAGMSYGQWKALQPVVVPEKKPEGWPRCEYCGTAFKPFHGKRFCNWECANAARYKKRAEYMRRYRAEKQAEGEKDVK